MWADLVLVDANVLTMNPSQPTANAIAVKDDKIVHVGTNDEAKACIGKDTKVISLKGKTVVPGFIDTHIHVGDFGRLLTWIDLTSVGSIKEMQKTLGKRAQKSPKGKWILGRGWNEKRFAEKRLPTRFDLDLVSPDNPVIFYHESGQLCVVNNKALELAGVTKATSAPSGGVIDRNEKTGELTGVLRENATNLVWNAVPEPNEEELVDAVGLAFEKMLEAGITSVHWIALSSIEISVIQKLHEQNKLPLRVYLIVPANLLKSITGFKVKNDSSLKVGGGLIFADGYLAARTAALSQPYSDDAMSSGKLLCTQEEMCRLAEETVKAGLQLVIHAVGDRAVDAALTTIETTGKGRRNRVEQAAVVDERLVGRMKKLNVIVSVQLRVVASEFSVWSATEHLGAERAKWLFPVKTLLREGVRVVGGSDCPMEPLNPLLGVQTAVTREVFPEERISVDEALRMYTVDAAYSSNEENVRGSVETGKLADLAVLSCDPRSVPPSEIESVSVEMTIVGGKVVFSKHGTSS
jgi:predicted amidohydrolase YtcJ